MQALLLIHCQNKSEDEDDDENDDVKMRYLEIKELLQLPAYTSVTGQINKL